MRLSSIVFPALIGLAFLSSSTIIDNRPEVYSSNYENHCVSTEEMELYNLIMEYRKENGLKPIPLSKSLSYVARVHAVDQDEHYDMSKIKSCNFHSWSKKGDWNGCCYSGDHKNAECMWEKPGELTDYKQYGYEISYYFSSTATAGNSLKGWKSSPGHNKVILNKGIWKDMDWEAIGIGMQGSYSNVWFGNSKDPAGKPKSCD